MAAEEKWYFTKEQLENSPSKKCDIDPEKELSFRQQAANFIQDMGQRLQVTQLCINTAIVYMHRFYVFHSFTHFHRNNIAAAALFLAAKVEEQPRKLEHVIKVAHMCLHRESGGPPPPLPDIKSEQYAELAHDLVFNENVLLQTLGFDVAIDHPHTHVVRCCHLVKASKDLAQTSYFLASNSLHLTTMCLKYKPTVVACFCIYLACKWSNWQIPNSTEGKEWFLYVDNSVTQQMLEELTEEFINIYKTCPSRLWKKIQSMSASQGTGKPCSSAYNPPPGDVSFPASCSSPMTGEPRKTQPPSIPKDLHHSKNHHDSKHSSQQQPQQTAPPHPHRTSHDMQNMNHHVYKEKRDRERQERQAAAGVAGHGYHKAPQVDAKHVPPAGKVPYGASSGAPVPPGSAAGPYVRHHRSSSGGVNADPSKMKMHPSQQHPVRSSSSSRSEHGLPPQQPQQQRQPAPPSDQPHGSYQRTSGIGDQPHNIGSSGNRESGQFNRPPVTAGGDFAHNRDPMRNSQSYHVKEQSDVKRSDHRLDYTSRDSRSSEQNNSASSQSVPYQKQLDNNSVENSESARHKAVYDKHSVNAPLQAKHENRHRSSRDVTTDVKQKHPQYQKQYVDMKNKQPPPPVGSEKINKFNQMQQPVQKSKSVLHPDEVKSLSSQSNTSKSVEVAQNSRNNNHGIQEEVSKKQIETNDQNNMLPLLQTPPPVPQKQKSIFSPDADISPKHVISTSMKRTKKTPPSSGKKPDIPQMLSDIGTAPMTALSPFGSPPLLPITPSKSASSKQNRNRTSSSNSEPELVPFIRKLEDETGFENIIRDAKVTIKTNDLPQKRPKPTMRVKPLSTDTVLPNSQPSLSQPIINGIETNPTLISNLLKEAMPVNNLSINETVKDTPTPIETPIETNHVLPETSSVIEEKKSEHHKSEKKKKKEKHKDKDKERSREEKKKKHKDKDRERHRDRNQAESMATPAESLIITIPKDKIIPVQSETSSQPEIPVKVKIKIQKEWLQTETISNPASAPPNDDLKVRISKAANKKHFVLNNRKRERDETSTTPDPPAKVAKTSYGKQEEATNRQNGRSSYPNKQVTLGDGALVQQQWSNSKYHSKQSGARPAS